jgi:hypothetical protein
MLSLREHCARMRSLHWIQDNMPLYLLIENMIYQGLDDEEADFLNTVEQQKNESDTKRWEEEIKELRKFKISAISMHLDLSSCVVAIIIQSSQRFFHFKNNLQLVPVKHEVVSSPSPFGCDNVISLHIPVYACVFYFLDKYTRMRPKQGQRCSRRCTSQRSHRQ